MYNTDPIWPNGLSNSNTARCQMGPNLITKTPLSRTHDVFHDTLVVSSLTCHFESLIAPFLSHTSKTVRNSILSSITSKALDLREIFEVSSS